MISIFSLSAICRLSFLQNQTDRESGKALVMTHQIRVHMAHIGAPVMGDQTYGKHRWLKAEGKGPAFERATATAKAFERQALHAAVLGFVHPITGKQLRFERPPPADMADLIDALRAMPQ